MEPVPFKPASPLGHYLRLGPGASAERCCEPDASPATAEQTPAAGRHRTRLVDLDPHLHCSVIGTCLGTAELRRLMARFMAVQNHSDLQVHHAAVSAAAERGEAGKVLQKALDRKHGAALQRFARARDAQQLRQLWQDAQREGDIPSAYWATLTHRHCDSGLRHDVFGDVHMLSHLVGSANRADLRRLVELERLNASLRDELEQYPQRLQSAITERDARLARMESELSLLRGQLQATQERWTQSQTLAQSAASTRTDNARQRAEQAEQKAAYAQAQARQLQADLHHLDDHRRVLAAELAAAEEQLRSVFSASAADGAVPALPGADLRGLRLLYVGGRPSSTPSIRQWAQRHGAEFTHHDGGLEDRKGLLSTAIARADRVVFPVDCVDHDSANQIKRLCTRLQVSFLPIRRASLASLIMALRDTDGPQRPAATSCSQPEAAPSVEDALARADAWLGSDDEPAAMPTRDAVAARFIEESLRLAGASRR